MCEFELRLHRFCGHVSIHRTAQCSVPKQTKACNDETRLRPAEQPHEDGCEHCSRNGALAKTMAMRAQYVAISTSSTASHVQRGAYSRWLRGDGGGLPEPAWVAAWAGGSWREDIVLLSLFATRTKLASWAETFALFPGFHEQVHAAVDVRAWLAGARRHEVTELSNRAGWDLAWPLDLETLRVYGHPKSSYGEHCNHLGNFARFVERRLAPRRDTVRAWTEKLKVQGREAAAKA